MGTGPRQHGQKKEPGSARLFPGPFRRKDGVCPSGGAEGVWGGVSPRVHKQETPGRAVRRAALFTAVVRSRVTWASICLAASCPSGGKSLPGTKKECGVSSAWSGTCLSKGFPGPVVSLSLTCRIPDCSCPQSPRLRHSPLLGARPRKCSRGKRLG